MSKLVCPNCQCKVAEGTEKDEIYFICPKCHRELDEYQVEEVDEEFTILPPDRI